MRNLKLKNVHVKRKIKRKQETVSALNDASANADNLKVEMTEADLDYDDVGL